MRSVLHTFGLMFFLCALSGCGEKTYEVPEVDAEESAAEQAEIDRQMQEEMERQMGGGNRRR